MASGIPWSDWPSKNSEILKLQSELAASWMTHLLPYIGERKLRDICVPGSHDAGMNKLSRQLRLGTASSTVTQTKGILGQLNCGVRRFDLRPCIYQDKFWCGHYNFIKKDQLKDIPEQVVKVLEKAMPELIDHYHGGDGCSLDEVIYDINTFAQTRSEVIVLELTHSFNMDREPKNPSDEWASKINQDELDQLIEKMKQIKEEYRFTSDSKSDVRELKISDIIGKGHSKVIITIGDLADGVHLDPKLSEEGFFDGDYLKSLTAEYLTVGQNPLESVCAFLHDHEYLRWAAELVAKTAGKNDRFLQNGLWSIIEAADYLAREDLDGKLDKFSSTKGFPNALFMDNIHDVRLISVVLHGMARVLFGKDIEMKYEAGKWKYDTA